MRKVILGLATVVLVSSVHVDMSVGLDKVTPDKYFKKTVKPGKGMEGELTREEIAAITTIANAYEYAGDTIFSSKNGLAAAGKAIVNDLTKNYKRGYSAGVMRLHAEALLNVAQMLDRIAEHGKSIGKNLNSLVKSDYGKKNDTKSIQSIDALEMILFLIEKVVVMNLQNYSQAIQFITAQVTIMDQNAQKTQKAKYIDFPNAKVLFQLNKNAYGVIKNAIVKNAIPAFQKLQNLNCYDSARLSNIFSKLGESMNALKEILEMLEVHVETINNEMHDRHHLNDYKELGKKSSSFKSLLLKGARYLEERSRRYQEEHDDGGQTRDTGDRKRRNRSDHGSFDANQGRGESRNPDSKKSYGSQKGSGKWNKVSSDSENYAEGNILFDVNEPEKYEDEEEGDKY